jgi:hypothetical protein
MIEGFVFHMASSLAEEVRKLLSVQTTQSNMEEFRARAAMVPYEVEDMSLGQVIVDGNTSTESVLVVYVGAKKSCMTLEDFFNSVRPYSTSWS